LRSKPGVDTEGAIIRAQILKKHFGDIQAVRGISFQVSRSQGVGGLRGAMTGIAHFGIIHDFAVLSVLASLFLILGSCLFSKIQI
jgi:hypothetical protein